MSYVLPGTTKSAHGFRGVEYDSRRDRFRARIGGNGRVERGKWLGSFHSAVEAAQAYDAAAIDLYGPRAVLNFPLAGERKVIPVSECASRFVCAEGHDLAVFGMKKPSGYVACRRCNAKAAARYRDRSRLAVADRSLS